MITRPTGLDKAKSFEAQPDSKRDGATPSLRAYECVGFLGHPVVRQRMSTRQTSTSPAVNPAIAATISDENGGWPSSEASQVAAGAAKTAPRKGRQSCRLFFAWAKL